MVQLLQQFAADARMRDLYSRGLKLLGDEGKIASEQQKAVLTCSLSSKVIFFINPVHNARGPW